MRFLHISDLHIGKRINEFSMIEDQRYILDRILEIADTERVDGVLIAGDVYDKPVPSAEAVQVFDWFLTRLAEQKRMIFVVSGNHDSAERIAFGSQIMKGKNVYVSPVYHGEVSRVELADEYGEIFVYLLPFIKPVMVRHVLEGEEDLPESYSDAVKVVVDRMEVDKRKRNLIVAHQFVTGAGRCDSEEVSVGGMDNVDVEIFDCFDYAALGHIHSPQSIKRETVRYCGTPLKYSFSEAEQEKSVSVVEFREKGQVEITTVSLQPLRDMKKIRGSYLEVTKREFYQDRNTEDYVQITLTDEEDILDGMQKLRVIYPNLMQLVYDNSRTRQNRMVEAVSDIEQKSEMELFEEFYELQNNRKMSAEQEEYLVRLIERVRS